MKRIYLPICLVLLSLLMTSCEKEEPFSSSGDATPIELRVVADNFVSTHGATRASEAGYVTTFTANDQIGIFAVKASNGFVLDKNIPYKYNGTAWVPVDDTNTVHHYNYLDDVTYFAYYPYSVDMNDAASEDDIVAKFSPKSDQSNYTNYTASDLMTGVGTLSTTGDTRTLTLELKHRMALLVLCPDPYATCAAPAGAGYEYYAEARTKGTITNAKINNTAAYAVGDDTYRLLVAPAKMVIPLEYTLGATTTSYTVSEQTLNAGTYRQFQMGHPALTVEREMQIGDYFYNNGKLMPGVNGEEPVDKDNCIGVVFHVGPGPDDNLADYAGTGLASKDKIHGYVVALTGIHADSYEKWYAWSSTERRIGTYTSSTSFQGYYNTQLILNTADDPIPARLANDYTCVNGSSPYESSGWYLGSVGQYVYMGPNLSKINNSLLKAGGHTLISNIIWTSTETVSEAATSANIVQFSSTGTTASSMQKTLKFVMDSRAVLTF